MTKSYNYLPENYVEDFQIDLLKDKKKLLLINVLSLVLLIPVALAYYLIINFTDKTLEITVENLPTWKLMISIVSMLVYIIVHELIHAIFFKLGTKGKVKFGFHGIMASASVPGVYFYKKPYLLAGLAPAAIMSVVLIIPMFFFNDYDLFLLFLLFSVHFSGCVGDFYIAIKLLKYPEDTLVEDTGTGMKFFVKK
ncbi:MAG: DUF3267 domain-containing protein [Candidatus Izemoplasmatales bacterium]|nr:DUF3267 domain-containing protein [Candidatus Izemoplasmatales bacterium]